MESPYQNLGGAADRTSMDMSKPNNEEQSAMPAAKGIRIEEEGFATEPTTDPTTLDLTRTALASENGSAPPSDGGICSDPALRFLTYTKSGDFLELVAWVVSMAILSGLPRVTARVFWRDIPYQETAAGDVLVELMFDNELVDETVNNQLLVVLGIIVPFALQMILCLTCGEKWLDVHRSICAFSWAIGLSTFVVEFTKHYVGYLRPNFYAKCGFDYETMQCDPDIDTNSFTGRRSFMSGHSSMSFSGLTVLSLYMQRLFGVGSGTKRAVNIFGNGADSSGNGEATVILRCVSSRPSLQRRKRILSFLCLLPIFLAVFIASSRVRDNYHHPADVVGGSIVGASAAVWTMGNWFDSSSIQIISAAE